MQAQRYFATFILLATLASCSKSSTVGDTATGKVTFSPPAGSYGANQDVTLQAADGARIFYVIRPSTDFVPYTGPISVFDTGTTVTIEAYSQLPGGEDLFSQRTFNVSATYTLQSEFAANPGGVGGAGGGVLGTVTFSPTGGTYVSDQNIVLACADGNAVIHYTVDGSAPTAASPVYSSPVAVAGNGTMKTIKAVAVVAGSAVGTPSQQTYAIVYSTTVAVVASPVAGTYAADQNVSLMSSSVGAAIYYTTDGSTPTTASTQYMGPIAVDGNGTVVTIRAIAVAPGLSASAVTSAAYTIAYAAPATPVFSVPPGTLTADTVVSFSSITPGVTYYYTTDGSTPTPSSSSGSSVNVAGNGTTVTIKAIAVASSHPASAVASATYTVAYPVVAAVVISPNTGAFSQTVPVTMTTATVGATIHYTYDGSTPTALSSQYFAGGLAFAGGNLKAIAVRPGWINSPVTSANLTVDAYVAPTGSDTTGNGNASTPYATPNKAFTMASGDVGTATMHLQAGTYNITSTLDSNHSAIRILGGYDSGWLRNPVTHVTTLHDATATGPMVWFETYDQPSLLDGVSLTLAGTTAMGVRVENGNHQFSNNTMTGVGSGSSIFGLVVYSGNPLIMFNKIKIGASTQIDNTGILINSIGGPLMYSNVIDMTAGAATRSTGIYYGSPADAIIANNTILFGGTTIGGYGIQQFNNGSDASNAYIENNIVFNPANTAGAVCIAVQNTGNQLPVSIRNNNLFNCATLYDEGGTQLTSAAAVNGLTGASDNIAFDMITGTNTYFVNETNDFHLIAGGANATFTATVKTGALSAGQAVVSYGVTTDFDGNTRTATGSTGWSMGAFEQDL